MGVELVEEVHDGIRVQRRAAHHDMLLRLSPVGGVGTTQFLAFHPREGQLLKLERKLKNQRRAC